jgi:uncharacterized protein YcfL
MKKYQYIPIMALLLIGGCSSEPDESTADQPDNNKIYEEQMRALEKAQAVEQVLQDGADKTRQAIEENSQ